MGRVVAELVVVPHTDGPGGISRYVALVENKLKEFNLEVMLTPMGTILEGDLDEIFAATRAVHEIPFTNGAMRVDTTLKIDDRRDRELSMQGKMKAVKEKM
jgi:uncharacterized protein (TIGR00106 family)